jgi:hypothetical protein
MDPDPSDPAAAEPHSPLEAFLRDYAEIVGGLWEEVEPQVYDLMLPTPGGAEPEVVRVAFDPEAVPEHPGAQLASFGTPLVDRLLADAVARGRTAELYLVGLSPSPQGLASRVERALTLSDGLSLRPGRTRALYFPQAVFWFEATFVSDQKEQDIVPVAIDLHQARQVRHLDRLLDHSRLSEAPWVPLPEARHDGLARGFRAARDRVVRTVAALANARARELTERVDRQVARMARYYADLRAEAAEQAERARARGGDASATASRREVLDREEQVRTAELRQKATLRAQLRLSNLLVVHQPKLWAEATVTGPRSLSARLELVWDPLVEALEAVACPSCGQPTFSFQVVPPGRLACPSCAHTPPPPRR